MSFFSDIFDRYQENKSSIKYTTPFRYKQGNDYSSLLFISLMIILMVISSMSLLNAIKMNVKSKKKEEDNEFTNVKCKLKKYMIKYMERVVFSVGALLIIWFVLEKIGVIKLISWLVDEDIQTFVYDIKDASGDSNFNLLDDHLVEKLNLYNVDSFYKFKIPISIDKNQFLNTCIQYSMVLSCYACITYIQSYFQSFKLLNNNNAADNSDMISRIKLKINNIIKRNNSGNQLKQQQQQQHQQVEKEEQSNTSKNNNSNTTNNNNSSISYFIYVESTIDQLLETPFTFLMIILLFSWILFRLYLENVPIHSLTGKWSIDQQISPIYFISFSTLLASIILLSFYILFLKYSFDNINNIIDNRKKLNKNRNSNNSNSNNNKKKNKKEKTTIDKKENHQGQEKINNQGDGDNNSDDDNLNIKNVDWIGLIMIFKIINLINSIHFIVIINYLLINFNQLIHGYIIHIVNNLLLLSISSFIIQPIILCLMPFCCILTKINMYKKLKQK